MISGTLAERFVQIVLVLTALTQLPPMLGVLGGEALGRLYGVRIDDPGLLLLMRHRAVLFAIVGVPLLIAVVQPAWRIPAMSAALLSVASFVLLASPMATLSAPLQRVAQIDWGVLALLPLALAVSLLQKPGAAVP